MQKNAGMRGQILTSLRNVRLQSESSSHTQLSSASEEGMHAKLAAKDIIVIINLLCFHQSTPAQVRTMEREATNKFCWFVHDIL